MVIWQELCWNLQLGQKVMRVAQNNRFFQVHSSLLPGGIKEGSIDSAQGCSVSWHGLSCLIPKELDRVVREERCFLRKAGAQVLVPFCNEDSTLGSL